MRVHTYNTQLTFASSRMSIKSRYFFFLPSEIVRILSSLSFYGGREQEDRMKNKAHFFTETKALTFFFLSSAFLLLITPIENSCTRLRSFLALHESGMRA